MIQGAIFVGEKAIGSFEITPEPDEKLVATFKEGLHIGQLIELATEAGTPVHLMVIPEIQD